MILANFAEILHLLKTLQILCSLQIYSNFDTIWIPQFFRRPENNGEDCFVIPRSVCDKKLEGI